LEDMWATRNDSVEYFTIHARCTFASVLPGDVTASVVRVIEVGNARDELKERSKGVM